MTGYPFDNHPAFDWATENLRKQGYLVDSPAEHARSLGYKMEWSGTARGKQWWSDHSYACQKWDLERCLTNDGVVVLPGWEKSRGAAAEVATARWAGKPIYEYHEGSPLEMVSVDPFWKRVVEEGDKSGSLINEIADVLMSEEKKPQPTNHVTGEVRVTDPITGGQKGSKPAQLGAIDPLALMELAKVAGFGAEKYAAFNYLRGYSWRLSYDALQRHIHAFWMGEDLDEESGLPHTAQAAWHGLALTSFLFRGLGTDDRYRQS